MSRSDKDKQGRLSIGYYGVVGRERTKVHVHRNGVGPICGSRISPDATYHWCSLANCGYIECQRCLGASS